MHVMCSLRKEPDVFRANFSEAALEISFLPEKCQVRLLVGLLPVRGSV